MTEKATFAAGCFWGVEAAFRRVPGVTATRVGFAGGSVPAPSYRLVCSGATGHAEAVEVRFDPERVSYEELLEVFWSVHDPTVRDRRRQPGAQYRSAIFFHSPGQAAAARASRDRLDAEGGRPRPIATEIVPAPAFHEAEEHHQRYLEKHARATSPLAAASAGA